MFLFETTFASSFGNVEQEIKRILDRAGAEILLMGKWDERKLAYEIRRQKRGCFVLVYFKATPESINGIERDCKLSESLLRLLIVSAEGYSQEYMERQLANRPEHRPSEGSDDRRGGDRKRHRRDDETRGAGARSTPSEAVAKPAGAETATKVAGPESRSADTEAPGAAVETEGDAAKAEGSVMETKAAAEKAEGTAEKTEGAGVASETLGDG